MDAKTVILPSEAPRKSAFQLGVDSGLAGEPDPGPPNDASSWSDRLYSNGWEQGTASRSLILRTPAAELEDEYVRERQR